MRTDTSRTIQFPFSYKYSRNGVFDESSSVTVLEPNWDKRQVFRRMHSFVAEAQKGIIKNYSTEAITKALETEPVSAPTPAEVNADDGAKSEVVTALNAMQTIRMGLSMDDHVRFCEYVQKELTNCKQLAYVGSDPEERIPITDGVWMEIAKEGGIDAVESVIFEFASFFFSSGRKSQTSSLTNNGNETQSGSPPPPREPSRPRKH